MLRSTGSMTILALLMVGCGGGGASSTASSQATVQPPPPSPGYTVGGTVTGLAGSGLTLAICTIVPHGGARGGPVSSCDPGLQISANGAFTLGSPYPAGYSGSDYVAIVGQPSSPRQNCVIAEGSQAVGVQSILGSAIAVSCPGEYAYVANAGDNTFSSYRIDVTTGALALIGTPTATGISPHAIVGYDYYDGHALKRHLFVANEGSNDISAFTVDVATGAISEVPGSPFSAGTGPQAMAIFWPNLFVANAGSDDVSVYTIDWPTGVLAAQPGSPVAVGKNPTSIAVDPYSDMVFVANHGGSNDISAFLSYDLSPVPGSPFPAGANPLGLALGFSQGGTFLYTANPDATNPSISGLSINSAPGASPLGGSPFPLPVSRYIATVNTGYHLNSYLYVTSGAGILGYASDVATGAPTALPGFPVATGANAYSIAIDPYNQFLYVANDGAGNISGFRLDSSTGALTPASGSPFPAGSHPQFIATF